MKELSLNILDITQNSITAGATEIEILLAEDAQGWLTLTVRDNGCGMSEEMVASVTDPFCTTRTTRKVGMGIPLLKLASEQTGGVLTIASRLGEGTSISATFNMHSIDFTPLGDMVSTVVTLIAGAPQIDFRYLHTAVGSVVCLDTKMLRAELGADIPLDAFEVLAWIREYLKEQYENFGGMKQ